MAAPSTSPVGVRRALRASLGWTVAGLTLAALPLAVAGPAAAGSYLTVFLLEKALSLDNVAIFALILVALRLPPRDTDRALAGGIGIALVLRIGFVLAGLALVTAVHDAVIAFGLMLVVSGARMALSRRQRARRREPRTVRGLRRLGFGPVTGAVIALGVTDLVMAVDSVPAAFAVTREAWIVLAATVASLLGLRPLFHLLAAGLDRFHQLGRGLGVLLVVTGAALCVEPFVDVPEWAILVAVAACIGGGVLLSVMSPRRLLYASGGGLLLVAGAAMLVLPGPGLLVIAAGLALLAKEFEWARRALDAVTRRLPERWRRRRSSVESQPLPPARSTGTKCSTVGNGS